MKRLARLTLWRHSPPFSWRRRRRSLIRIVLVHARGASSSRQGCVTARPPASLVCTGGTRQRVVLASPWSPMPLVVRSSSSAALTGGGLSLSLSLHPPSALPYLTHYHPARPRKAPPLTMPLGASPAALESDTRHPPHFLGLHHSSSLPPASPADPEIDPRPPRDFLDLHAHPQPEVPARFRCEVR